MIRGFSNPDIRQKLQDSPHLKDITDPRRQSAKVTRIFNRCHAHGLIAKIPHSRRWRLINAARSHRHVRLHSTARRPVPNQSHETDGITQTSLRKTENVQTKDLSAAAPRLESVPSPTSSHPSIRT